MTILSGATLCLRRHGRPTLNRAWSLALVVCCITFLGATFAPQAGAKTRIRAHIPTWAFDDGCNGGAGASSGFVHRWVNYAESNCGVRAHKARANCHSHHHAYCRAVQYLDTDWYFAADGARVASVASPTWWLHEPAPNQGRMIFSGGLGGAYLIDQARPQVRSFFRSYVRRYFNRDDGLMMDWQSPSLPQELYYSSCGCTSTREIHSSRSLRAAHEAMSRALTHRNGRHFLQIDNSLPDTPWLPQGLRMINRRAGVIGWTVEGEPMSNGVLDSNYATLLDQTAYVATRTRGFIAPMSRAPAGAPYQARTRRVQEATMLLGFRPGHMVDWANLEAGSPHLAVWPEEGIYPARPLQSMRRPRGRGCLTGSGRVCARGGHRSIQVAPGVYRREFRHCYLRKRSIGPCATIMNTTGRWIRARRRWLRIPLFHQITFSGGDVQSGGQLDLNGATFRPGLNAIAPCDAVLLDR